jgi:cytochrome c peroxidase
MQNRCRRAIIVLLSASGSISEAPILREMVAGAQYFHNGSAATLLDAVKRYDQRLNIGSAEQDGRDSPAFLQTFSARRPMVAYRMQQKPNFTTVSVGRRANSVAHSPVCRAPGAFG